MSAPLISLQNVSLSLPHKKLVADFTVTIHDGDRIAFTGPNGGGKTSLLHAIANNAPQEGSIKKLNGATVGLLPQTMVVNQAHTVWQTATELVADDLALVIQFEKCNAEEITLDADDYDTLLTTLTEKNLFDLSARVEELLTTFNLWGKKEHLVNTLSGGQQTILGLVRLMACQPTVLFLDEPTNNLDSYHREQLYQFLASYNGACIIISHDLTLLRSWPKAIWHLEHGIVSTFSGTYDAFCEEKERQLTEMVERKEQLLKDKKNLERVLDNERKRASQRTQQGIKKHGNDRTARGAAKERAEQSTGQNKSKILAEKEALDAQIKELYIHKVITPSFVIDPTGKRTPGIYVHDGAVNYGDTTILSEISLALEPGNRVALTGRNGSGKSTLLKALRLDKSVTTDGSWQLPNNDSIGYLDQHYGIVQEHANALEAIKSIQPEWKEGAIRAHLSTFLFRNNHEVTGAITNLSGGEKARLSLAMIAAQSPSLLLLDEITNNIDLITRQHCLDVIAAYPGIIIAVSHDNDFLEEIDCSHWYEVKDGTVNNHANSLIEEEEL